MSLARLFAALTAALIAVAGSAAAAAASTAPDSWPEGESFTALEWIGTYIGGAVVLIAVIWVLAAAVNAKARHHVVQPSTDVEKVS